MPLGTILGTKSSDLLPQFGDSTSKPFHPVSLSDVLFNVSWFIIQNKFYSVGFVPNFVSKFLRLQILFAFFQHHLKSPSSWFISIGLMIGCWANTWNLRERKLLGSLHYLSKSRMCLLYTKSLLQYRSINRFHLTSPISFTAPSFKLLAVWGILCRKFPFKLGQVDRRWAMSLSPRYVHICLTDFGISRPNMQQIFR